MRLKEITRLCYYSEDHRFEDDEVINKKLSLNRGDKFIVHQDGVSDKHYKVHEKSGEFDKTRKTITYSYDLYPCSHDFV